MLWADAVPGCGLGSTSAYENRQLSFPVDSVFP